MAAEQKAPLLLTRKGKWLWIAGTLFVAVWMFVLGLVIGRGNAPIDLESFEFNEELAALKATLFRQEQAKVAVEAVPDPEQAPKIDFGFYDELRKDQAQIPQKLGHAPPPPLWTEAPAKNAVETDPLAEKSAPDADGAHKVFRPGKIALRPPPAAELVKTVSAPAVAAAPMAAGTGAVAAAPPRVEPLPKATPVATVRSGSRFTIQVAAVKDAAGADQIVKALRAKNFPAYHLSGEVPGKGVWFRVRVGAFADRESADAMREQLSAAKFQGMVVATP